QRRGLTPARLALATSVFLGLWAGSRYGLPIGLRAFLVGLLAIAPLIPLITLPFHPRLRRALRAPGAAARPAHGTGRDRPARGAGREKSPVARASDLAASPAWLQVLSGPDPERLRHGLLEACAALLERGERLLVVDAARRLRLHEALGRDREPGLLACLARDPPAPEALRGGGQGRLCLLLRGDSMRPEVWPRLGRLLSEVRPHFDRVLLSLDFAAPRDVGPQLASLEPLGWWCGESGTSLLPEALAERIGI